MKVVNITKDDYANFSHDNAKALRSVGVDCIDIKINKHISKYETESQQVGRNHIKEITKDADFIQVMHSDHALLGFCSDRPMIVWHTGTRYRQRTVKCNQMFNHRVKRSVLALGEFWKLGAKNPIYCVGAVNTDKLQPSYYKGGQPVIGHYPSNPEVKGTQLIIDVMRKLKKRYPPLDFRYSIERVLYPEQLKRLSEVDIYIELFALTQKGKPYGSWGITALEAASMGKIVFSNDQYDSVYQDHYQGFSAIRKFTTTNELSETIRVQSQYPDTLRQRQEESRQWVIDNHSYKATGEYILKHILI